MDQLIEEIKRINSKTDEDQPLDDLLIFVNNVKQMVEMLQTQDQSLQPE